MDAVDCPKCLGVGETMTTRKKVKNRKTGFKYETCSLCKGAGVVTPILAEDFIFSLNEENIEEPDNF